MLGVVDSGGPADEQAEVDVVQQVGVLGRIVAAESGAEAQGDFIGQKRFERGERFALVALLDECCAERTREFFVAGKHLKEWFEDVEETIGLSPDVVVEF